MSFWAMFASTMSFIGFAALAEITDNPYLLILAAINLPFIVINAKEWRTDVWEAYLEQRNNN